MTATAPLHEREFLDHVAIDDLPLNELMELWQDVKHFDDGVAALKKSSGANLDAVRAAMERRLRESGATSHTDAATGINCRIEKRMNWAVTDPAALHEYLDEHLLTVMYSEVSTGLVLADVKRWEKEEQEPLHQFPGIEQVESKRLVVTPPKK